jgi:hypothetical protein
MLAFRLRARLVSGHGRADRSRSEVFPRTGSTRVTAILMVAVTTAGH